MSKQLLLVDPLHPDETVDRLRDIFAQHWPPQLYDNGSGRPVRIRNGSYGKEVQQATTTIIIREAHKICQPVMLKGGQLVPARLTHDLARHYLEHEDQRLPRLKGVVTTPLLQDDGTISKVDGYDKASGLYCYDVPDLTGMIPDLPTRADAETALRLLRETFRTFCFRDASRVSIPELADVPVVDIDQPIGVDESAFHTSLLTCVCLPSLPLAPGVLFRGPSGSGSGAGKGLSAKCIFHIGFGRPPPSISPKNKQEDEKGIATALIERRPAVFLDNFNRYVMSSDALASYLTEVPCAIRTFRVLKLVTITAASFVIMTGNGVILSLDHARRWLIVEFDPKADFPENRWFAEKEGSFADRILRRRKELLAAVLTIWRWGRTSPAIKQGVPLGSYEAWAAWCRDPLLALGCPDPVPRLHQEKARDPERGVIKDVFEAWWQHHHDDFVLASNLHEAVKATICACEGVDPARVTRQYIARKVVELDGTEIGGFKLVRCQDPKHLGSSADWGYRLTRTI